MAYRNPPSGRTIHPRGKSVRRIREADGRLRYRHQFAVVIELDYQVIIRASSVKIGHGRTVNLSSCSVLFEAQEPLPLGKHIKLACAWPVRRNEHVGLTLLVMGRIVSTRGNLVSVAFSHYEFRTRSLGPLVWTAGGIF